MIITKLNIEHLEGAKKLVLNKILEEKEYVPDLPNDVEIPNLDYFIKNDLGVVALEDGNVIGFIGVFNPWEGAFDTFDSLGTFSPYFANATIKENRARIYQDMIEYAYEKWKSVGIVTAGLALSAHDTIAKNALFEYGFGMRCKDLITKMEYKNVQHNYDFYEIKLEDFYKVRELRKQLDMHLKKSPCFLQSTEDEYNDWISEVERGDRRTFVLSDNNEIIAYIDITDEGDNFISYHEKMVNISGAYSKEEYRGSGCYDILLFEVMNQMLNEGFIYLGVDHESYNPTANRYWKKHFKEYTNSVVKRIENWSKNR